MWSGVMKNPEEYDWQKTRTRLDAVRATQQPPPDILLQSISCRCKKGCGAACGCRKIGLKCSALCFSCNGVACENIPDIVEDSDAEDHDEAAGILNSLQLWEENGEDEEESTANAPCQCTANSPCQKAEMRCDNIIEDILTYGRYTLNTEDYKCLAMGCIMNDKMISFYLEYLVSNLPKGMQDRIHVFSTYFYSRLTGTCGPRRSCHGETAQERHDKVKTWTRKVNIFKKDFIIIPINEANHWLLAIICFPGMVDCSTIEQRTYDDAEKYENYPKLEKISGAKQACILIFDSLAGYQGVNKPLIITLLREYLTCEYQAKTGVTKIFNELVIRGTCPEVPQQPNVTDCGLYLLQYVENFFSHPIQDYRIPITECRNWFNEFVVTKKREEISILVRDLMVFNGKCTSILPNIPFPTFNGELINYNIGSERNISPQPLPSMQLWHPLPIHPHTSPPL